MADRLPVERPGEVILRGGECPWNIVGWWNKRHGPCEFVVAEAHGKIVRGMKMTQTAILECRHCGARIQVMCLTGPKRGRNAP